MKKWIMMLCMLLCMALAGTAAAQTLSIDGVFEPARTISITAPYSGRIGDFTAEAGDVLAAGETLLPISAAKVYADFDGVVSGVFAAPGDSTDSVTARYGALMYLERTSLYKAECTTQGAAADNENKIVHPGETVYVQSTSDNKRDGVAVVTAVAGKSYTLEILSYDELRVNDNIRVYRKADHDGDSCIGTGKVERIDPVAVTAQGHVLAVHAENGDTVSRGDLLMEIVPDALEGMTGGDGFVRMPQDGVLLSVNAASGAQAAKDETLAVFCPAGEIELVCSVDEEDLALLAVGDRMNVTVEALGEEAVSAQVVSISAAADESGSFAVTLVMDKTEGIRIGMSATAEK